MTNKCEWCDKTVKIGHCSSVNFNQTDLHCEDCHDSYCEMEFKEEKIIEKKDEDEIENDTLSNIKEMLRK